MCVSSLSGLGKPGSYFSELGVRQGFQLLLHYPGEVFLFRLCKQLAGKPL